MSNPFKRIPTTAVQEERVIGLYLDGYSIRGVSETTGLGRGLVCRILQEDGVKLRRRGGPSGHMAPRWKLSKWIDMLGRDEVDEVIDEMADILDPPEKPQ